MKTVKVIKVRTGEYVPGEARWLYSVTEKEWIDADKECGGRHVVHRFYQDVDYHFFEVSADTEPRNPIGI